MDNSILTSNSSLLIKHLRKKRIISKTNIYLDKLKINNNNFQKSFNFKENHTTKNILLPSLSGAKLKFFTKSNSRASSSKEETNNEKENRSAIKKNNNKRKLTLKVPEKIDNLKNVRNRIIKRGNNYFKTESNQRIIFNNIGINYHKMKYNNNNFKRSLEKKENSSIKEVNKMNGNINILNKEKIDKDDKIEKLEKKIDKLISFINNNEILNLKNKINSLENDIEILKKENKKLKNELDSKNKIISSFTKIKDKMNEKKINSNINAGFETHKKIKYKLNEIDVKKLKLISIDPDDI